MRIVKATWFAVIGVLLSLFVVGAAWALPPRITWEPERLAPESVAPGESVTYSVTLKHTGILPIPATRQLRIVPEGALAHYVTVTPPVFPPVLKRGDRVSVQVTVNAPPNTPLSVVRDELLLERIPPNGKTLEVFRAEALPVELTFSPFPLPPDPGEAGKVTIAGIDSNGNGVRDDVERWIALQFEDASQRTALSQAAKAFQQALIGSESSGSQERAQDVSKSFECVLASYPSVREGRKAYGNLGGEMMNTEARYMTDRAWRQTTNPALFPPEYLNNGCE